MKKLISMLFLLVLGFSLVAFTACGKEEDTGIAGTYKFNTMIYEGTTYAIGDEAPWGDMTFYKDFFVLTVNKDGTWSSVAKNPAGGADVTDNGTWALENDVLTMISSKTSANENVSINGDVISMTQNHGTEITYTFKKE